MGEGERNPEIFLTCKIENEKKKNKNMFRNFRKRNKQKKRNGKHITQEKRRWEGKNQNEIYQHDLVLLSINNRIQLNTADMWQFLMSIELVIR